MLWRPRLDRHLGAPARACVLLFDAACALPSPATPLENSSRGGPQLTGSWLLPVMPASPETLVRFAKYGVTSLVSRVN